MVTAAFRQWNNVIGGQLDLRFAPTAAQAAVVVELLQGAPLLCGKLPLRLPFERKPPMVFRQRFFGVCTPPLAMSIRVPRIVLGAVSLPLLAVTGTPGQRAVVVLLTVLLVVAIELYRAAFTAVNVQAIPSRSVFAEGVKGFVGLALAAAFAAKRIMGYSRGHRNLQAVSIMPTAVTSSAWVFHTPIIPHLRLSNQENVRALGMTQRCDTAVVCGHIHPQDEQGRARPSVIWPIGDPPFYEFREFDL